MIFHPKYIVTLLISFSSFSALKAQSQSPSDSAKAKFLISHGFEKIIKDTTVSKDNAAQHINMDMMEQRIDSKTLQADSVQIIIPQDALPMRRDRKQTSDN